MAMNDIDVINERIKANQSEKNNVTMIIVLRCPSLDQVAQRIACERR